MTNRINLLTGKPFRDKREEQSNNKNMKTGTQTDANGGITNLVAFLGTFGSELIRPEEIKERQNKLSPYSLTMVIG